MALKGALHAELEVKSPADKIWETLRDCCTIFPKALPQDYKSIEVLEGDGKKPGSIRYITYPDDTAAVKVSKERIEVVDVPKKSFTYCIIGGDMLKYFKEFRGTVTVVPKENGGSLLKWAGEYEKVSEEIPDPTTIKDFAIKNFKDIDDYLLKEQGSA